ncbi:MAG TPA: hypothetical protein VMV49_18100 [Candidatus Deferrimicrobium sp.]|nr:hypothetical protein [Candidatus Deferrimicrobium sp.]
MSKEIYNIFLEIEKAMQNNDLELLTPELGKALKNLCEIMYQHNNYRPIDKLMKKDPYIFAHLLKIQSELDRPVEIFSAINKILEGNPKTGLDYWNNEINRLENSFKYKNESSDKYLTELIKNLVNLLYYLHYINEETLYYPLKELIKKNINFVQHLILAFKKTELEQESQFFDKRFELLRIIKFIIINAPQFLTKNHLNDLYELIYKLKLNYSDPTVIISVSELVIDKVSHLLDNSFIEKLYKFLLQNDNKVNKVALLVFETILKKAPSLIPSEVFDKFFILFLNQDLDFRLQAFKMLTNIAPLLAFRNPALYGQFVKALNNNFDEFIQSDEVNMYLHFIGSDYKLENGLNDLIIIPGYEPERGTWSSFYGGKIRFGNDTKQLQGLIYPIILTPNFFRGKNIWMEAIEYRIGIRIVNSRNNRDIHLKITPIIIRETKDKLESKIFSELDVKFYNFENSLDNLQTQSKKTNLGSISIVEQFIAFFWSVDDFLRSQNKKIYNFSDKIWVKLFSSKYIFQMLQDIEDRFLMTNSDWMIANINNEYLVKKINLIGNLLEESGISEELIAIHVKDLCEFMIKFEDFRAIEVLKEKNIDIFPFLIQNLNSKDFDVVNTTLIVLKRIMNIHPDLISHLEFESLMISLIKSKRLYILKELEFVLDKMPQYFNESFFNKMLEQNNLDFKIIKIIIEQNPTRMDRININTIIYQIMHSIPQKVNWIAFKKFESLLKYIPQFIAKVDINLITDIFEQKDMHYEHINEYRDEEGDYCVNYTGEIKAQLEHSIGLAFRNAPQSVIIQLGIEKLKAFLKMVQETSTKESIFRGFERAFAEYPKIIDSSFFDEVRTIFLKHYNEDVFLRSEFKHLIQCIFEKNPIFLKNGIEKIYSLLTEKDDDLREIALQVYKAALVKNMKFIKLLDIEKVFDNIIDKEPKIQKTLIEIYRCTIDKDPNFITKRCINHIQPIFLNLNNLDNENMHKIFDIVFKNKPEIITQSIVNKLLDFITFTNWITSKQAENLYHLALDKTPHLIPQTLLILFNKISINQNNWSNIIFKQLLNKAYHKILKIAPQSITKSVKNKFEAIFPNDFEKVKDKLERILNSFSQLTFDKDWDLYYKLYDNYESIISNNPDIITLILPKLFQLFANPNWFVRWAALQLISINHPQFLTDSTASKIKELLIDNNVKVKWTALRIYKSLIEMNPLVSDISDFNILFNFIIEEIKYEDISFLIDNSNDLRLDEWEFESTIIREVLEFAIKYKPKSFVKMLPKLLDKLNARVIIAFELAYKMNPELIDKSTYIKLFETLIKREKRFCDSETLDFCLLVYREQPQLIKPYITKILNNLIELGGFKITYIISIYQSILETIPECLDREDIQLIMNILWDRSLEIGEKQVFKICELILTKIVKLTIEEIYKIASLLKPKDLIKILNLTISQCPKILSSIVPNIINELYNNKFYDLEISIVFKFLKIIFDIAPQYITQENINGITKLLSHYRYDDLNEVKKKAFDLYQLAIEKQPNLIKQTVPILLRGEIYWKSPTIEAYKLALRKIPDLIEYSFGIILEMLSDPDPDEKYKGIIAFNITIGKTPEFLSQGYLMIFTLINEPYEYKEYAYHTILNGVEENPEIFIKLLPEIVNILNNFNKELKEHILNNMVEMLLKANPNLSSEDIERIKKPSY